MEWISIVTELLLPLLGGVLTVFVIPLLRQSRIWSFVQTAVAAAEQLFGAGTGEEKYRYVSRLLCDTFGVQADEAERLIEAAVYQLTRVGTQVKEAEGR